MINQYKGSDLKIYNNTPVLDYYSLNGISEWAFLGYSALTFVFFFLVAYLVRMPALLGYHFLPLIILVTCLRSVLREKVYRLAFC